MSILRASMVFLLLLVFSCATGDLRAGAFLSANVTCPSSGNKPLFGISTKASLVQIGAPSTTTGTTGNAGTVWVGGSSITTTNAAGIYLNAGDSDSLPVAASPVYDLSTIYIACTVTSDSVGVVYVQ